MAIQDPNFRSAMGSNGGSSEEGNPIHHATRMVDEAQAFGRSLGAAGDKLSDSLDLAGRVQRNPIGAVMVAVGIGYVLGGGLFSPVTRKALKIGLRLAVIPFIKGQISALAGGQSGEPL